MDYDLNPGPEDLWFLPLGGTGEIGMNMNLYGHKDYWLMVDCGVMFDEPVSAETQVKSEIISADPQFIAQRKEQLCGLIITHAHEDHIGAVAFLWPRLGCPIYTTPFTACVLRKKLGEAGLLNRVQIHEVTSDPVRQIGPFSVQWMALTHSIPEPHALFIQTDVGSVLHTGDWKIDPNPVVGRPFNAGPFLALSDSRVGAVVGDSTNALRPGHTLSESKCYNGLLTLVDESPGRVVIACFASNVARLHTILAVAKATNRYVGLLGRSLHNMVARARESGYWSTEMEISDVSHLGYLPTNEVLFIATGSQGETRTALHRLSVQSHPSVELEKGDTVIFSSMVIPGNEIAISRLRERLKTIGVRTIATHDTDLVIHTSGHPSAEDLSDLYQWVQPRIVVPTHGEPKHLDAHAAIAKKAGVSRQLTGSNGDLYYLSGAPGVRKGAVKTGRIALKRS